MSIIKNLSLILFHIKEVKKKIGVQYHEYVFFILVYAVCMYDMFFFGV